MSGSFEFDNLDEDFARATAAPKAATRRTFKCESCNGSGMWSAGRANIHGNAKCNACAGRGHFVTSANERAHARTLATTRAKVKATGAQADNAAAIGGTARLAALAEAAGWSEFAASLHSAHLSGRVWSEKQVGAVNGMLDKLAAKKSAAKTEAAAAPVVDLTAIKAMFDNAVASGYKRPCYRAEGLSLSRAPDHGNNPGALYVKDIETDAYLGKVVAGAFQAMRNAAGQAATAALLTIAADPLGAAVRYGQRTGTCSCCGRKLTNHTSIDLGIGPVCRGRWGL